MAKACVVCGAGVKGKRDTCNTRCRTILWGVRNAPLGFLKAEVERQSGRVDDVIARIGGAQPATATGMSIVTGDPIPGAAGRDWRFYVKWKCACGWAGDPSEMVPNPSEMLCCPSCGASGGLISEQRAAYPAYPSLRREDYPQFGGGDYKGIDRESLADISVSPERQKELADRMRADLDQMSREVSEMEYGDRCPICGWASGEPVVDPACACQTGTGQQMLREAARRFEHVPNQMPNFITADPVTEEERRGLVRSWDLSNGTDETVVVVGHFENGALHVDEVVRGEEAERLAGPPTLEDFEEE